MAYAGALFADACLRGLNGDPDVIECTYVASSITEVPYFSSKVKLGKNGEHNGCQQLLCVLGGACRGALLRSMVRLGKSGDRSDRSCLAETSHVSPHMLAPLRRC